MYLCTLELMGCHPSKDVLPMEKMTYRSPGQRLVIDLILYKQQSNKHTQSKQYIFTHSNKVAKHTCIHVESSKVQERARHVGGTSHTPATGFLGSFFLGGPARPRADTTTSHASSALGIVFGWNV